ncbi:Glycosyltransferase involved in cell wall bisynthesis [Gammaproteobacteria bacterium]
MSAISLHPAQLVDLDSSASFSPFHLLRENFVPIPSGTSQSSTLSRDSARTTPRNDGRLRIAIVTETFPPEVNGVALTVAEMVHALANRGHQIQVIRPRQPVEVQNTDSPAGVETLLRPGIVIPWYNALRLGLPSRAGLLRQWSNKPPAVVYIATEGPLGWSAAKAARDLGIPALSGFHTRFDHYTSHYGLAPLQGVVKAYLHNFHNLTQATVVATEELKQDLEEKGFHRVRVLPRGVDTKLFSPTYRNSALRASWGAAPDDPVVLYVGRLAAEKNLEVAISAYRAMQVVNPRTRFVLVGDGPLRVGLAQIPDLILCGTQRGEALAAHYASADIFLFPSLSETFGNVVLEAMASVLAVVAYDYAAARAHIRHRHDGLRIPCGNTEHFHTAALELIRDPAHRAALAEHARTTALQLDYCRIHDALEVLLHETVGKGGIL